MPQAARRYQGVQVVGLEQLLAPLFEAADLGGSRLAQLLHQLLRAIQAHRDRQARHLRRLTFLFVVGVVLGHLVGALAVRAAVQVGARVALAAPRS